MYKSMKERFRDSLDMGLLENPLVPRQSENARWLLEQRYFADRYDPETGGLRKERSFEEFARRVSRIVCTAESLYRGADEIEWIRRLEKIFLPISWRDASSSTRPAFSLPARA